MDSDVAVNERVYVLVAYPDHGLDRLKCLPSKMNYRGEWIQFKELGLRHPTSKGQRMVHVFDMVSDSAHYRLEFDAERLVWTLVSIKEYGL